MDAVVRRTDRAAKAKEATHEVRRRRFSPETALIVALLVTLGSGAYAAIPDSEGQITACFLKSGGTLRVIDADGGDTCKSSETQITWTQEGQPGPQGPQGEKGDPGEKGEQGLQGDPGGLSGHEIVRSGDTTFVGPVDPPPGSVDLNVKRIDCPAGKVVTGSGPRIVEGHASATVVESFPYIRPGGEHGSQVTVRYDPSITPLTFRVEAVCVDG